MLVRTETFRAQAAAADYSAVAVVFDGTNDWLGTDDLNMTNSKVGLLHFFINPQSSGALQWILVNAGYEFKVVLETNLQLTIGCENSAGSDIGDFRTSALSEAAWTHILASWDLANARFQIRVNDVSDATEVEPIVDDLVNYSEATNAFGSDTVSPPSQLLDGYVADFMFWPDTTLDLDVADNRRKFTSVAGKADISPDDIDTNVGVAAGITLTGDASSWHTNKGSLGSSFWTLNGALTTAPSSPSD